MSYDYETLNELDYDQAIELMRSIPANSHPEVFWDNGWGDSPGEPEITITRDGNGQKPLAKLSDETYRQLLANDVIGGNILQTYKARKVHPFKL